MPQPPGPGRTVPYRITEDDARNTTRRRVRSGTTGNHVDAGQRYPARLRGDVPGTWPRPECV
ncbi:hypothetical protein AB0E81_35705 [Streptomyces sp. NPDC033538]|uniref:hypothetical protein n=1 Tax=Streptomyces sp. NPDC033538 TaxID=3155367 RepID=UPI003408C12D